MDNTDSNSLLNEYSPASDNVLEASDLKESEKSGVCENNLLSDNSAYIISSNATNDEIQSIIDSSNSGDTIQFNEQDYYNLSLIVNKRLNIISSKNSIIHSSLKTNDKAKEMGISDSFCFYFTKLAAGSLIKGLSFKGNSDYPILIEGSNQITISQNNICCGKKAAILVRDSSHVNISNNLITNACNGIAFENVNRSKVSFNRINSNTNIGISLEKVFLDNITNNSISNNGLDGILMKDAKSNRILKNNITENGVSGLRMEGSTTRNMISYNNISSNVVNIYANSLTNGDQISQNTLMFARKVFGTYVEADNVGAAIVFADNYSSVKQGNMLFTHNSIGMNDVWDAKSTMSHPSVNIGGNWYFDNDGNYGLGHICPMVFGRALDPEEFLHLSMGFGGDENGIFGQLYDGDTATGAGAFTIDNVNINGKDYGSVTVGEDGRFNLDDLDFDEIPAGSVITVTVGGHSFNITVDEKVASNKSKATNSSAQSTEIPKNRNEEYMSKETKVTAKVSNSPNITGNGSGSGSGSLSGSGSGEGNFTGSGISVGDLSGQSNQGTGESGENGGGSASEGVNAYEIVKEEKTPATAKNSQLIALFGVALVILIIALGYRSKNKDDFNDDGDFTL